MVAPSLTKSNWILQKRRCYSFFRPIPWFLPSFQTSFPKLASNPWLNTDNLLLGMPFPNKFSRGSKHSQSHIFSSLHFRSISTIIQGFELSRPRRWRFFCFKSNILVSIDESSLTFSFIHPSLYFLFTLVRKMIIICLYVCVHCIVTKTVEKKFYYYKLPYFHFLSEKDTYGVQHCVLNNLNLQPLIFFHFYGESDDKCIYL